MNCGHGIGFKEKTQWDEPQYPIPGLVQTISPASNESQRQLWLRLSCNREGSGELTLKHRQKDSKLRNKNTTKPAAFAIYA